MVSTLVMPRIIFGRGASAHLAEELSRIGITRPLLISDRGVAGAGLIDVVRTDGPTMAADFLDVPENPTAAGADAALAAYDAAGCDGVVALGGGSVLDTAKFVAALATVRPGSAAALVGRHDLLCPTAPVIALPTTVGTGSESSPVAALHLVADGPAIGTRSSFLVPIVAICDASLTDTLPRRLIAATGIDALSHCIEGFFAEPAHPIIDALALDGIGRVFANIRLALAPEGGIARQALMAAAFAGGVAINKGLGPAHAVALSCGDQNVHHGTLIAVALPHTVRLVSRHAPEKADHVRTALGLESDADIGDALHDLVRALGLPTGLVAAGYRSAAIDRLAMDMAASPFNRTSPFAPTAAQYRDLVQAMLV